MKSNTLVIALFGLFAIGLPIYGMFANDLESTSVHGCYGECYEEWEAETGGVVAVAEAQALARAEASPEELGKQAYIGCVACHGAGGEGGIGPALAGQTGAMISDALRAYKAGETRGNQSNMMWSQASMLSEDDIDNISAYIETL